MKTKVTATQEGPDDSAVREIFGRAEKGDKTVLPVFRQVLDLDPELWAKVATSLVTAKRGLVKAMAGENLLVSELLPRKLEAMATEVAGPSPTPLEKLLADQIAVDWLALLFSQSQAIGEMGIPEADFHQRRINSSHHRYLSAIRTLGLVRRLLRPAVTQVNIAGQQVNVANLGRDSK